MSLPRNHAKEHLNRVVDDKPSMPGEAGNHAFEILLAEDDPSQQKILSEIMVQEGFRVTACGLAQEALDYLESGTADVAIIDLHLPDLEENTLLRRLSEFTPNIPIVLNTGYASLHSAQFAVNIGAFAYIEKHADPSELIGHIHRAVETRMKHQVEALEAAVQARTRELILANAQLRTEIAERKAVEESLRISEERFRAVFEQAASSIIVIDAKTHTIVEFNDRAHQNLGYSRDEFRQLRITDIDCFLTDTEIVSNFNRILQDGCHSVETQHRCKDGSIRDVLVTSQAVSIPNRTLFMSISVDITDRKQAEQALEASAIFLDSIIQQNPSSLWISDSRGYMIKANRACRELFGVEEAEVIGRYNILHDNVVAEQGFLPLVESVFKEGRIAHFEIDYNLSDVHHITPKTPSHTILEVIVAPIKDSQGNITNAIVQHKDITDLRRAQDNLRQREAELAHIARVASMGEMVATIAHEVNQPLHAISSYSNGACLRLKSGNTDSKVLMDAMEHISNEAHRASETIRRLRRLLQKHQPSMMRMSVNQSIRDALSLIQREASKRNVQLILDLAEDLPPITADPIQIEQVILNLIRNAFDAMDQAPMQERKVSIVSRARDDKAVEISIQDSGIGLDPENQEQLFDAFFTSKPKGMGMGLAICRFLIESHSGKIWFEPGKPQGAIFHFTLPVSYSGEVHEPSGCRICGG